MTSLGKDFHDFFVLLNRHNVLYLVAGGFAVAVHGQPRYTKDIDIWLKRDELNAAKMERILHEFGFGSLGLSATDFMEEDTVILLGREPNRIDLLTEMKGLDFDECYPARMQVMLSGVDIDVLDCKSLIRNKQVVGRPQDLVDAEKLANGARRPT